MDVVLRAQSSSLILALGWDNSTLLLHSSKQFEPGALKTALSARALSRFVFID
ncbi:unnamed protein product [Periconia digitata]|uniref:Uncharacterized protein n=1 Tax=Periconia digitata TaxID=1303443 RepID=A0A9W4UFC3_9PLEO|nr:unnamed protein product [Periconia digitata]